MTFCDELAARFAGCQPAIQPTTSRRYNGGRSVSSGFARLGISTSLHQYTEGIAQMFGVRQRLKLAYTGGSPLV